MIVPAAFLLSMLGAAAAAMSAPAMPPPAGGVAHGPQIHGTAASLFSKDDYPAAAVGTGAHGKVVARLTVDTAGRVSACSIVQSSGFSVLDAATCQILRRRARYSPYIDTHGQPATGTVDEQIVWRAE